MLGQSDLGVDEPVRAPLAGAAAAASPSFADKTVLSRAIIVAAGPFFNFAFAIAVFAIVYGTVGRPSDAPVVAGIVAGSPAATSGLAVGDRILSVAGEPVRHVHEVPAIIGTRGGEPIELRLSRAGHDLSLTVTPRLVPGPDRHMRGQLGIEIGPLLQPQRVGPIVATYDGAHDSVVLAGQIGANLWKIVSGGGGTSDLGGPLRIAQVSGQAAQAGPGSLLLLIAMISVNLALVNLLPVPVLDGGHLLFYACEAVLGRPLSARTRALGLQAGLALIASLFVFVTVNDLTAFGLFHWVQGLAG